DPERPDSERSDPEPLARQGTRLRASLLGGLLALCVGVHLIGIALFSLILVDLGLGLRGSRGIPGRRRIAEALLPILLVGGTLSLVGLGWLALGPGGARTLPEALDHFLEYHRTGEFGPRESGLGGRLLEAYGGLRAWLLAEAGGWPWLELPIVLGLLVAGISGALRRHPGASRLLLAWLLLLLAHLLFFAPWDPESWATLSLPLVVLLTLGLDARVRERPRAPRRALALLALGALALLGAHDLRLGLEARDRAAEVYGGIAHPAPMASIARALDRRLERDALLLVEERLDASYLQIFTDRDPIIPNLVGLEARALREERLFSVLSLRYYQQRLGPAQLLERLRLRPTYWLGARLPSELRSVETIELGWGGLSLHRLDPSEAPSARALRLGRSLDASR
ncbi:MAG: hypothetical protein OEY14_18110, partial [Myxococcales bacterium]|nr:hypothetical protein [Myxococcales bacterium]